MVLFWVIDYGSSFYSDVISSPTTSIKCGELRLCTKNVFTILSQFFMLNISYYSGMVLAFVKDFLIFCICTPKSMQPLHHCENIYLPSCAKLGRSIFFPSSASSGLPKSVNGPVGDPALATPTATVLTELKAEKYTTYDPLIKYIFG